MTAVQSPFFPGVGKSAPAPGIPEPPSEAPPEEAPEPPPPPEETPEDGGAHTRER